MSIQKDKNGTYIVQYTYFDALTGKEKRTKKRGFKTKFDAKQFEASLSRSSSDVLFYDLFLEHQKQVDENETTYKEKIQLIKNHIPAFIDIKYEALTKPFLLKVRNEIGESDFSAVTKNKVIGIIKSTCKYANDVYDLPDNSKIIKPFKKTKPKMQIWSLEEYEAFERCVNIKYKPFFRLIYFTGLRKGEAKALMVDDLDVNAGTININKSMRRDIRSLKAPKTASSNRIVKLDKITLEMLLPLKSHEKWLFGDFKPLNNTNIDRAFNKAIEEAGIKKIRIHDLRHSHCSWLVGNGIDVVSVANRLGHSNINTTLSTYSHALENADNKIVDFLNCSQNVANK